VFFPCVGMLDWVYKNFVGLEINRINRMNRIWAA